MHTLDVRKVIDPLAQRLIAINTQVAGDLRGPSFAHTPVPFQTPDPGPQPVTATVDPYPSEPFTGEVTMVVRAIDPSSRTFMVEAEMANRDGRLAPGLFARVDLSLAPAGGPEGGSGAQAR